MKMKKTMLEMVVGKVIPLYSSMELNTDSLKTTIEISDGVYTYGQVLHLFDHRPETLSTANASKNSTSDKQRGVAKKMLAEAMCRPALVTIAEEGKKIQVHFYPANNQTSTALFSMTHYKSSNKIWVEISMNNSFWNWQSEGYSMIFGGYSLILCALTDQNHPIVVEKSDYCEPSKPNNNKEPKYTKISTIADNINFSERRWNLSLGVPLE